MSSSRRCSTSRASASRGTHGRAASCTRIQSSSAQEEASAASALRTVAARVAPPHRNAATPAGGPPSGRSAGRPAQARRTSRRAPAPRAAARACARAPGRRQAARTAWAPRCRTAHRRRQRESGRCGAPSRSSEQQRDALFVERAKAHPFVEAPGALRSPRWQPQSIRLAPSARRRSRNAASIPPPTPRPRHAGCTLTSSSLATIVPRDVEIARHTTHAPTGTSRAPPRACASQTKPSSGCARNRSSARSRAARAAVAVRRRRRAIVLVVVEERAEQRARVVARSRPPSARSAAARRRSPSSGHGAPPPSSSRAVQFTRRPRRRAARAPRGWAQAHRRAAPSRGRPTRARTARSRPASRAVRENSAIS